MISLDPGGVWGTAGRYGVCKESLDSGRWGVYWKSLDTGVVHGKLLDAIEVHMNSLEPGGVCGITGRFGAYGALSDSALCTFEPMQQIRPSEATIYLQTYTGFHSFINVHIDR